MKNLPHLVLYLVVNHFKITKSNPDPGPGGVDAREVHNQPGITIGLFDKAVGAAKDS